MLYTVSHVLAVNFGHEIYYSVSQLRVHIQYIAQTTYKLELNRIEPVTIPYESNTQTNKIQTSDVWSKQKPIHLRIKYHIENLIFCPIIICGENKLYTMFC